MSSVSVKQIMMARAALGWSFDEFAKRSSVSARTIRRIERENGLEAATAANVKLITDTLHPPALNSLVRLRMALEFVFGPQSDNSKHNNLF